MSQQYILAKYIYYAEYKNVSSNYASIMSISYM